MEKNPAFCHQTRACQQQQPRCCKVADEPGNTVWEHARGTAVKNTTPVLSPCPAEIEISSPAEIWVTTRKLELSQHHHLLGNVPERGNEYVARFHQDAGCKQKQSLGVSLLLGDIIQMEKTPMNFAWCLVSKALCRMSLLQMQCSDCSFSRAGKCTSTAKAFLLLNTRQKSYLFASPVLQNWKPKPGEGKH